MMMVMELVYHYHVRMMSMYDRDRLMVDEERRFVGIW
jgi:hypothetical protein